MSVADLDPAFVVAYEESMFDCDHRAMIAEALEDIDAARQQLIDAQNALVDVLDGTSDYARRVFSAFYAGGLVTAADWRTFSRKRSRRLLTPPPPRRGQLRLVRKKQAAGAGAGARARPGGP